MSGVITNVLNPKVALFFLAFLPQFIDVTNAQSSLPFLVLGLTFVATGTIWSLLLANFSARLSNKLRDSKRIKAILDKISGILFIGLGIHIAFSKIK